MRSQYHMDLEQFTLEEFRRILEYGYLLPSERVLREDLPKRFAVLETMGIRNLKDLTTSLNTKKRTERFADASGLPLEYLTVLRRRAGTYTPRPKPPKDLPGIEPEYIHRLSAAGVRDTKQLFDRARTPQARSELARQAKVPSDSLLELTQLSDLQRAPYVGPVFARLFHSAGADTLEKLAACNAAELLARIRAVNEEQKLTKGALPSSVAEMEAFLEIVRMIPKAVEY